MIGGHGGRNRAERSESTFGIYTETFHRMTITSISEDSSIIWGNFRFDSSFFTSLGSFNVPVVDKIYNTDLATYDKEMTGSTYKWNIQWQPITYCPHLAGNPSRFISALGKYNIGDICITYRGQCTDEFFINYLSQRYSEYSSWAIDYDASYPSSYVAPAFVAGANQQVLNEEDSGKSAQGDQLQINLLNADISSFVLFIYYQATQVAVGNPAVFGEF
jgi:hypothetical protein